MKRILFLVCLLAIVVLAACQQTSTALPTSQSLPSATAQPTTTPTIAFTPTNSVTPESSATPTATPEPQLALVGTKIPAGTMAIDAENAKDMRGLAVWGEGNTQQMIYSQDGQHLFQITSLEYRTFDAKTLSLLNAIPLPEGTSLAKVSPDGKWLATYEDTAKRLYFNRIEDDILTSQSDYSVSISTMSFSFDGRFFVGGNWKGFYVFDLTGEPEFFKKTPLTYEDKWGTEKDIEIASDGQTVAIGFYGGIQVWDVAEPRLLFALEDKALSNPVFSPDGQHLAVNNRDYRSTNIYSIIDGTILGFIKGGWLTHISFSSDSQRIAVGTGTEITVRDFQTFQALRDWAAHDSIITDIALSPDGEQIISRDNDGNISLWDVSQPESSEATQNTTPLANYTGSAFGEITQIHYSNETDQLAVLHGLIGEYQVKILNGENGIIEQSIIADYNGWNGMAFLPDGKTMVLLASYDDTGESKLIKFINVLDGTIEFEQKVTSDPFILVPSDNGKYFAVAESDYSTDVHKIEVFSTTDRTLINTFPVQAHYLAISSDGKFLASREINGDTILWDIESGEQLPILMDNSNTLAISPDGKTIATHSVWDIESGKRLLSINGNNGSLLTAVTYSTSGNLLLAGYEDGSILIVDTANWKKLVSLTGHRGKIVGLLSSEDEKRLYSASGDGTIRVWGLP